MATTRSSIARIKFPILPGRPFLLALAALLVLTGLSLITASTPSTLELLAGDIPLEGHVACQACLDGADAAWWQCVQTEAGGDVGDADCADKRGVAIGSCQTAYCNQTAELQAVAAPSSMAVLNLLTPTAHAATCDSVSAMADCEWKKSDRFHSCLLTSGPSVSVDDCYNDAQRYYRGCMKAWGCGVAPTSGPGDN